MVERSNLSKYKCNKILHLHKTVPCCRSITFLSSTTTSLFVLLEIVVVTHASGVGRTSAEFTSWFGLVSFYCLWVKLFFHAFGDGDCLWECKKYLFARDETHVIGLPKSKKAKSWQKREKQKSVSYPISTESSELPLQALLLLLTTTEAEKP